MTAKILNLLLAFASPGTAGFTEQNTQPDIDWLCEGQTTSAAHIHFNLLLTGHDGNDFREKRMERFQYNGQPTTPIDLGKATTFCGWDEGGRELLAEHEWKLEGRQISYASHCPNRKFAFTATCRD